MAESSKFKLGQSVELISNDSHLRPLGRFEIVRLMPTERGVRQYRIRSTTDGHERMATEVELA